MTEISPSEEKQDDLQAQIISLNERLESSAMDTAEQAFSATCLLSLTGVVILGIILFIFLHWVPALIVTVLLGIAGLGISSLLANRSHRGNLEITYQREMAAEIDKLLEEHKLEFGTFLAEVQQTLDESKPLRAILEKQIGRDDE